MKLFGLLIIRPRPMVAMATEVLAHGRPCPECGAWRCPTCGWLILSWQDHRPGCKRRRVPS